jgi:inward rectifier potassium channel
MSYQGNQKLHIVAEGVSRRILTDLYHRLIAGHWLALFGFVTAVHLLINLAFAGGYAACGDEAIDHVGGGSLLGRFFFSVQTLSTIGYGTLAPLNRCANLLVTVEAIVSLGFGALVTGLVFGKFSRPTSRLIFSDKVLLSRWDGAEVLMLRLGNARANELVAAAVEICAVVPVVTEEGHSLSQLVDLRLRRNTSPLFQMSWLLLHPLDEKSPLHGYDLERIKEDNVRLIVSVTAHDGSLGQTVYARHIYGPLDFQSRRRFVDVIEPLGQRRFRVDYRRFHDTEALPGSAPPAQ